MLNVYKGGTVAGGTLSGEAIRKMLGQAQPTSGIIEAHYVTWHDFRQTFAGNLWDTKIEGVTIQKLMGHA